MNYKKCIILILTMILGLSSSCDMIPQPVVETPFPTEYLPTMVALTFDASGIDISTPKLTLTSEPTKTATNTKSVPSRTAIPTSTKTPTSTSTLEATATITTTKALAPTLTSTTTITATDVQTSENPVQIDVPVPQSEILPPEIPEARVQIYQLGDLSMVTSPIVVSARLTSKVGKVIRIELFGEDGRLLARQVRTFENIPWHVAKVGANLEFEISVAAEIGRLVISVEDQFGRLVDINSVDLILLSSGATELNPASALLQRIIIQEPGVNTLIQGGNLIVSGRARPNEDQPLKVQIITEDGRVIGQRLAGISIPIPGDYGQFAAEVPYTVSELTPALLIIYEDGGQLSEISHLASLNIILAP